MLSKKTLPGFYTEHEVADMLRMSVRTLRNNAARRKGPPRTTVHRRVYYRVEAFDEWLRAQECSFDTRSDKLCPEKTRHENTAEEAEQ